MDDAKLTPEELEEMEKQFWEIVRKYRPEISEEKNLIQNNKIYAKDCAYGLTLLHSCEIYSMCRRKTVVIRKIVLCQIWA